ncbi:hypothetical protein C265_18489 [Cupriavidus sp. GA3-3]|nr:hypothetical protein C265_18489 [Cupriavidus sp. GA3-3]
MELLDHEFTQALHSHHSVAVQSIYDFPRRWRFEIPQCFLPDLTGMYAFQVLVQVYEARIGKKPVEDRNRLIGII